MGAEEGVMLQYFHLGYEETLLLQGLHISSPRAMVAAAVFCFILALIQESLQCARQVIQGCFGPVSTRYRRVPRQEEDLDSCEMEVRSLRICSVEHLVLTLVHLVQVILSYCIMMVFMTFNTWLCLAVVLGHAVGYLLFGHKHTVLEQHKQ